MSSANREGLRQRADYTHKFNAKTGRHGWLRLTPAYSVKIVDEIISRYDRPLRIFDPFSGTATTALSAAYHGHVGVTTDINPFLVWFGRAKTAIYAERDLVAARDACHAVSGFLHASTVEPAPVPPLHNIDRWWRPARLLFLCRLRSGIEAATDSDSPERTLLLVAFCRTLIVLSNAAFNHQSMSFKDDAQLTLELDPNALATFEQDVAFVLAGARENPGGRAEVFLGDAREPASVVHGPFDRVITSPPYANRMSYIRELRPYMYWLGFLENGRDAGELDWRAIGGTWGVATSRLADWDRAGDAFASRLLTEALARIVSDEHKNGRLLANYVAKYVDDMWLHFQRLRPLLAIGAELHYIVGNSSFYGVLLPVEELYAGMLTALGFEAVTCVPIRKRNSKKELIEFDVTARWPG